MKYLLTILVLLAATGASANSYVIKKASANVRKGAVYLGVGMRLTDKERVSIPAKGYLEMACMSGKGMLKFHPLRDTFVTISGSCPEDEKGNPVLEFLLSFFNTGHDDWRHKMSVFGGVSRGRGEEFVDCVSMPDSNLSIINYCDGEFSFSLPPVSPANQKTVITNYGGQLVSETAASSRLSLHEMTGKLKKNTAYMWYITNGDIACSNRYALNLVSPQARDSMVTSLSTFVNTSITDIAQQKLILASLLECNHYFADALRYYKEAARADKRYEKNLAAFMANYK